MLKTHVIAVKKVLPAFSSQQDWCFKEIQRNTNSVFYEFRTLWKWRGEKLLHLWCSRASPEEISEQNLLILIDHPRSVSRGLHQGA